MEVGLSGSVKVDSDVGQGTVKTFECSNIPRCICYKQNNVCYSLKLTVYRLLAISVAPKILEALKIAETYMEKTEKFDGKVRYSR